MTVHIIIHKEDTIFTLKKPTWSKPNNLSLVKFLISTIDTSNEPSQLCDKTNQKFIIKPIQVAPYLIQVNSNLFTST